MNKEILFYDVEVFPNQSCVVFKNIEGQTVQIFTDNTKGLGKYADEGVLTKGYKSLGKFVEDKVLYGYNNYGYDDYILYAMIIGLPAKDIKAWNDSIITKKTKVNMKKYQGQTYDIMQQIDVSFPSLKKIEGNLGHNIYESDVAFDKKDITPEENLEIVTYCENDVLETIGIYHMRKDYFSSKETIINMLDESIRHKAYKWNTTSIIGQLLAPKKPAPKRRMVSDEMLTLVPSNVREMWLELDRTLDFKFKTRKVKVSDFGCVFEFGWGGLHGAPEGNVNVKNVKLYDVASMYPSILILFNGLGDKTQKYSDIKKQRIEVKRSGDKTLDSALKLILNSTYGILNNKYSPLNNPYIAYSICIYGQISLYVLCEMLHLAGCKIINANTDGVAFIPDSNDEYKNIVDKWQKKFSLDLDLDEFSHWIQKDVNNYIAVTDKGAIKVKGGDVNNYHDFNGKNRNYNFNNGNTRIIQKALVDKLVYDKPIEDTITGNIDKPILYQYVLQAGGTYQGTFDNNGNKMQKINRVFASKSGDFEIAKKRVDGGLVKFADAPSQMFLHNEDLSKLKDFNKKIDLNWYNNLAYKVYERWKG